MGEVETREVIAGQMVPGFSLPSLEGGEVKVRDYRQRRNLVIAIMDLNRCDGCTNLLREFADNYHTYRDLETQILIVLPHPMADIRSKVGDMGLPFPVLSDEGGQVSQVYLGHRPGSGSSAALFITDRYGELRVDMKGEGPDDLPGQQSIIDWLSLLETECPECG